MANIGTISHGTMRSEDLIETFSDELREHASENGSTQAYCNLLESCEQWLSADSEWQEQAAELGANLVSDLFDALNEFAPSYCYFGAHEGDGSDYGFWPCIEQIEEDCQSGELIKIEAGDEPPVGVESVAVNDHGNMTFYGTNGQPQWDCV
jgi:hypothetical protein